MENFNLEIESGSFTVLLGPSGCGKTTLIRLISGLESCTEGAVWIAGNDVTHYEPGERGVAVVFQNYALYPHMTVEKNISFGLRNFGYKKDEIKRILAEVLDLVGLSEHAGKKPSSLSGGQKQRVALARAISKSPDVFLMDEPLSNLDARLRAQMRGELIRIHRKLGATFVYITHDQAEAMSLGDYIAVMDNGRIMQYGTSEDVYGNPANVFTARFIGDPGMNILSRKDGTSLGFRGQKVCIGRPEGLDCLFIRGAVSTREHLGDAYSYKMTASDGARFEMRSPERLEEGALLDMFVMKSDLYAFDEKGTRIA
ncbi:MAG: ABC transporter ATP-binding protein [Synergistaceae bacterium]|jgi:sn-glycerol 3-phosphate transport system ATP-binding protein|nr:ABC transporter ATP-binding protein [Synergistaceae bacterium]